jgi:hypothetical protein
MVVHNSESSYKGGIGRRSLVQSLPSKTKRPYLKITKTKG